jgi:hypothetical protein
MAAPKTRRSARMWAIASGSSAGPIFWNSQLAWIPAAEKPELKRLTAGSPSPSPPSSSSRDRPLLEAVLLEEAGELFVGLGVVVVTLGVGEVEEVPGVRGLERGIDGFDARVRNRPRWKSRM